MNAESQSKGNEKPVCFVVMPISDIAGYEPGHFGRVYEHLLKPAIIDAGYIPVRADDTNKTDYIVVSVIQKVVDSAIVLCDYSARNPNVMYELGIRHAFNRPVVLVKDIHTEKVFDIQGLRYTEYDANLRVDTVQKDILRISNAIKDTASNQTDGYNSVVHLAGLTAAQIPEKQKVSVDTQVLLSAIASLERRIDSFDQRSKPTAEQFFYVDNDSVVFSDGLSAKTGDMIYNANGTLIGTLIDMRPTEQRIIIKNNEGRIFVYSGSSIKSKGISSVPF